MADPRETQNGGMLLPPDSELTLDMLPLNHPIRMAVRNAHDKYKAFDRDPRVRRRFDWEGYRVDRSGYEYIRDLQGLFEFFLYVGSLEQSRVVLDIGAGDIKGASNLATFFHILGADVQATILEKDEDRVYPMPEEKIHETSVEYLDGFASASVAGILGLISMAYSVAPEFAVRKMDEVLVPGGAIKASFKNPAFSDSPASDHFPFSREMARLNYDFAIKQNADWDILVGIKPGGQNLMTAQKLLEKDALGVGSQLEHYNNLFR